MQSITGSTLTRFPSTSPTVSRLISHRLSIHSTKLAQVLRWMPLHFHYARYIFSPLQPPRSPSRVQAGWSSIFEHLGAASWHRGDAAAIKLVGRLFEWFLDPWKIFFFAGTFPSVIGSLVAAPVRLRSSIYLFLACSMYLVYLFTPNISLRMYLL